MEVPDLVVNAAARFPDRAAVIEGDVTLSFADLDQRAGRLAAALAAAGIGAGDRVAILASNDAEFTEVRVGVERAAAVLVPLNHRLNPVELAAVVADAEPRVVVVGRDHTDVGAALAAERHWHLGSPPVGHQRYETTIAGHPPMPRPPTLPADELAVLAYTSGTTGRPKGAMLTHGALFAGMVTLGTEMGAGPDHTYLGVMPMFHIGAQVGWAFTYRGATSVQLRRFDPCEVMAAIDGHRVTHTQLVPTMIQRVLDDPARDDHDLSSLAFILYGAAAMPVPLLRRLAESLRCRLFNGYGLTEALGLSALRPDDHRPDERPELLASVGTDMVGQSVRVIGSGGTVAEPHEIGEVVCRGPSVMSGYWQRPSETAEAIVDGWLHTRDLGYRDENGYLYLVDRLDDMITTGGENVYPAEVENALLDHPAVREAAVIGLPDPTWGQRVHAVVVLDERLDETALRGHCRGRIAGYKVPRSVEVVDELPRNATGKLLRQRLRTERVDGDHRRPAHD